LAISSGGAYGRPHVTPIQNLGRSTFQSIPIPITVTQRANPYPKPWTHTIAVNSPWLAHRTSVFHAIEILHHRRNTIDILGTTDPPRLVGTIVWHTVHRDSYAWQGTLDDIPYHLHS